MDHSIGHGDKDITRQLEKEKGKEQVLLWRVIMRRMINPTEDGRIKLYAKRLEVKI